MEPLRNAIKINGVPLETCPELNKEQMFFYTSYFNYNLERIMRILGS